MKIIVGSTNPVKIKAVEYVFSQVYGDVQVEGVEVVSGVSEQPHGDKETIKGARKRAEIALISRRGVEYGVGLEGGVYEQGNTLYECAWCAVWHTGGEKGLGGGLRFELPPMVVKRIRGGEELGPVMDETLGRSNVKAQEGAVGVLTKNHVTREGAYREIIYLALIRFVSPDWY